ncbi:Chfr [Acrasis kona]|uniref:Chfr n=1 Tax=Acrasis kona TaxID=1008807 RepID=A0AAW2YM12_9EUKA
MTQEDDAQQQLQEMVVLCPHLQGMTDEEQKESLKKNSNILNMHLKGVGLEHPEESKKNSTLFRGRVPSACPFADRLNASGPKWKPSDFRCGICKHYLHEARKTEPCKHDFCDVCLKKVGTTKGSSCPTCQAVVEDLSVDTFKQYTTDSYIKMQFELCVEDMGPKPEDPMNEFLYLTEQSVFFDLNVAIGNPTYLFNSDRSLFYANRALDSCDQLLNESKLIKFINLKSVVKGKIGDIYAIRGQHEEAKTQYKESICSLEEVINKELDQDLTEVKNTIRVTLVKLGDLYLHREKEPLEALNWYSKSTNYNCEPIHALPVRIKLGEAKAQSGDVSGAKSDFEEAESIIKQLDASDYVDRCREELSRCMLLIN